MFVNPIADAVAVAEGNT